MAATADGIGYEYRVLRPWVQRFLPLSEIRSIECALASVDSESGAETYAVEIATTGRKQRFGSGIPEEECRWLAWKLATFLGLGEATEEADPQPLLEPGGERPSDCDWVLEDDGDSLAFRNIGRMDWKAFLGLLAINLFWNGIVAVFVGLLWGFGPAGQKPQQPAFGNWWCMFFFLVPFQLIGLGMIVALLSVLVEPFRRTRWTFRQDSVEGRTTWFGCGRTRSFAFDAEAKLTVRERPNGGNFKVKQTGDASPDDTRFELTVEPGEVPFHIRGLTLGEAKWMKAEMESRRPGWFARPGRCGLPSPHQ